MAYQRPPYLRIEDYPDQVPLKDFYSTEETAQILLLSPTAVQGLIKLGKLQYVLKPGLGVRYRIPLSGIEAYCKANPERFWALKRINRRWDGTGYPQTSPWY